MTKRTHLLIGSTLVLFGVLLSGCEMGKSSPQSQEVLAPERPGVTLKGNLIMTGDKFFIKNESKMTEITSKKVELKSRVGTEIEVYGEFSGTTLYVDEVRD